MKFTAYKIEGMTCDSCAASISKLFKGREGIISENVSYPEAKGEFEYDSGKISEEEIIEIINKTGHYRVTGKLGVAKAGNIPEYDLIIIGGGSAAFSAAIKAEESGKKTLMINDGLDLGGTCVNVGCVPSKYLVRAGETAHKASHSNFQGIRPTGAEIDFAQIIRDKKKLVSAMQQKKYMDVVSDFRNLTLLKGRAKFKNNNTVTVNGKKDYRGEKILIATGARTSIPDIKGLHSVNYLTNISLFNLEKQPGSMIILGGGYIALEIAQAYHRLGTKVTVLQRSKHILSKLTPDVSEELKLHLQNEGIDIHTGIFFDEIKEEGQRIKVFVSTNDEQKVFEAEKLVVATGIKPNTDNLGIENTDVVLNHLGQVIVNERLETGSEHVFAAGDVANTPAYVYTAAHEGKIAVENAFSFTKKQVDYSSLPWVVFTDPQVAGVGMDETEAAKHALPYETSTLQLKDIPGAIAANDTRGFIKLIRNKHTDRLLGARVVAPGGGELVQLLGFAIRKGITVKELAEELYPYLTLSEGIKLAAISFGKDVSKLSCCAG